MAEKELTIKQQTFVDCYNGDIKEAAAKADLSYGWARHLITFPHILNAIQIRQDTEIRPNNIADRQQRQEFWTKTMTDNSEEMKDRLKASELLGKSEADFTDNIALKNDERMPGAQIDIVREYLKIQITK